MPRELHCRREYTQTYEDENKVDRPTKWGEVSPTRFNPPCFFLTSIMLFAPGGPQSPRRRNRLKAIFLTILIILALYFLFFAGPESAPRVQTKTASYAQQHGSSPKTTDEQVLPKVRRHKEMVVASMMSDDTSWLEENFPEWSRSVYVVDNKRAPLTVAQNKGRESMVYLT